MAKFFVIMFVISIASLIIAFSWNSVPIIKDSVHAALNPTAGKLLEWNLTWGMLILVFIIAFFTTLVQKYATDQEALKELKAEQKELQKDVKEFKDDPQKMLEMNQKNMKRSFEIMGQIMTISMKATVFTIIPFILLFRWFMDVFTAMGNPKFFGFLGWIWFYLIFIIVFSSILRKVMDVH